MKAIWNGTVVADSDDTVMVEGNHYFPAASLVNDYFQLSEHTSFCPWKGTAHYYSLHVDGQINANAAWYYPDPKTEAESIQHRVAFWQGVRIV